jgi:hypothetical protein
MPGESQRADALAAITAMLDATLHGDREKLSLLRDATEPGWSGATRVITRHEDSTELLVASFDEDLDPATATLPAASLRGSGLLTWREEPAPPRRGDQHTNGVLLGWDRNSSVSPPTFMVHLPADERLPDDPVLILDIAAPGGDHPDHPGGDDAPYLTIELTADGASLLRTSVGEHGGIPPAPTPRRLKSPLPDLLPATEPIATTVRIPLEGMGGIERSDIRLVFDRTPSGLIRVDRIAVAPG